jgi:hypothetical protein
MVLLLVLFIEAGEELLLKVTVPVVTVPVAVSVIGTFIFATVASVINEGVLSPRINSR